MNNPTQTTASNHRMIGTPSLRLEHHYSATRTMTAPPGVTRAPLYAAHKESVKVKGSPRCPLNPARARHKTPHPLPNQPECYTAIAPGVAICEEAAAHPARQQASYAVPRCVWAGPTTAARPAGQSCPTREPTSRSTQAQM